MRRLPVILFFISTGFLFSQEMPDTFAGNYPPKSIQEAIAYMEFKWTDKEKQAFKDKVEQGAVLQLHMGYGMWIRNSWLSHGNPKLSKYFYRKKVFHRDSMSSIILTAFHRKLNNKKLDLNDIFKPYKRGWKAEKPYRKIYRDSINKVFDCYKINDTLTWKYYTTVIGVTPEETEKYKDCKPKAIILKKSRKNQNFLVRLISSCNGNGIDVGVYGENFGISNIGINKTGWTSYWEWETKKNNQ